MNTFLGILLGVYSIFHIMTTVRAVVEDATGAGPIWLRIIIVSFSIYASWYFLH